MVHIARYGVEMESVRKMFRKYYMEGEENSPGKKYFMAQGWCVKKITILKMEATMQKVKSNVRIADAATLSQSFGKRFGDSGLSDTILSEMFQKLAGLSAEIVGAMNRERLQSSLSEEDAARDALVRTLGDLLSAYANSPFPGKAAAAETLLAVYSRYGKKIARETHARESSLIDSLIADFEKPEMGDALKALPEAAEVLAKLKEAEGAFKSAYFANGEATRERGQSAHSIKSEIFRVVNEQITAYLDVMEAMGKSEYAPLSSALSVEIDRANGSVRKAVATDAPDSPQTE